LLGVVLAAGALLAAGCGSSSKSSSSAASSAASAASSAVSSAASAASSAVSSAVSSASSAVANAGLAAAQAEVAKYTDRPTKITLTEPVGKPIPTGKVIYQVTCGAEACDAEAQMIKSATDILGWTLKTLHTNGTPQEIQAAWQQVVRDKPDGVMYTAQPRSEIDQYIKQAAANGTKIAACCIVEPATDGITYTTSTPEQAADLAKVMAAWPIVDAAKSGNMKPGAVYLNVPDFTILSAAGKQMKTSYNEYCSDCEYNELDIGLADLQGAPDQVVSFLRAHPNTKYVIQSTDSVFLGLPAALKAAGLNDIKIFGEGPSTANQANIASGVQAGTMAFAFYENMFAGVDALARAFVGVPQETTFTPPNWILTKDNIPSPNQYFPVVPTSLQQFKALWGK
jgi:ribose transport system substrate-binding protein